MRRWKLLVALVGLPGSGKSSVARALARRLGWRLADTDSMVEQSAGRTVSEVFAAEGEDGFRARELEVLRLIALGHTNAEIAQQLYLSVRTVETHRAHIQQKLRRSSRSELVRYAFERGVLPDHALA